MADLAVGLQQKFLGKRVAPEYFDVEGEPGKRHSSISEGLDENSLLLQHVESGSLSPPSEELDELISVPGFEREGSESIGQKEITSEGDVFSFENQEMDLSERQELDSLFNDIRVVVNKNVKAFQLLDKSIKTILQFKGLDPEGLDLSREDFLEDENRLENSEDENSSKEKEGKVFCRPCKRWFVSRRGYKIHKKRAHPKGVPEE